MKFQQIAVSMASGLLAPLLAEKTNTHGDVLGVGDLIGGGQCWLLQDGAQDLAVFVTQKIERENGRELIVRAALQLRGGGSLTEDILPEIERVMGHDCAVMTIHTKRAGLMRKLQKSGYQEAAKIMQKRIAK
jgi:hypothetical protein